MYKTDRVSLIIWAGSYLDQQALHPPPDSWASNDTSDVAIMHLTLSASGSFTLPASELGSAVNRMAYFVEGSSLSVGGKSVLTRSAVTLSAAEDALFENTGELGSAAVEVLILQGRPISEPIAQHGNDSFDVDTTNDLLLYSS